MAPQTIERLTTHVIAKEITCDLVLDVITSGELRGYDINALRDHPNSAEIFEVIANWGTNGAHPLSLEFAFRGLTNMVQPHQMIIWTNHVRTLTGAYPKHLYVTKSAIKRSNKRLDTRVTTPPMVKPDASKVADLLVKWYSSPQATKKTKSDK